MLDVERIKCRAKSVTLSGFRQDLIPQLKELTVEMHTTSSFTALNLDLDRTMRYVSMQTNGIYFKVAERSGEVLGALYGYASETFFSADKIAKVMGVWIAGKHQGSMGFIALLMDFEEWARTQGAKLIFLDQTTALDMERSQKLFDGCGYSVCGLNTVKEL